MKVFAVDTGPQTSGWIFMDGLQILAQEERQSGELTPSGKQSTATLATPNADIELWLASLVTSSEYPAIRGLGPFASQVPDKIAIEWFQNYGQGASIGQATMHAIRAVGRMQMLAELAGIPCQLIYRRDIRKHITGGAVNKSPDSKIRANIMDRYPATGGGSKPEIGTKKQPGPLYGISTHTWSAMAIALTAIEASEDAIASTNYGE